MLKKKLFLLKTNYYETSKINKLTHEHNYSASSHIVMPLAHRIPLKILNYNEMKILGNIIWLIFGGFAIFLEYIFAGIALCLTIVGIPFGLQSFKLGMLALWPFGQKIEYMDYAPGCLSTIMNIIWFFIGGIWIALTHLFFGILLGITIIGIPWAKQHFKMMSLAFTPFGRRVV